MGGGLEVAHSGALRCKPPLNFDKDLLLEYHGSLRRPPVTTSDCVGAKMESPPRTAFQKIPGEKGKMMKTLCWL